MVATFGESAEILKPEDLRRSMAQSVDLVLASTASSAGREAAGREELFCVSPNAGWRVFISWALRGNSIRRSFQ